MKTINKYLFSVLAGVSMTLAACSDDIVREPSPLVADDCLQMYFAESNQYDYELDPEEATQITLTVGRLNTESAATVGIEVISNTDNVFQIPESVSFEAGQSETTMTINFPDAEVGISYQYEISFEEGTYNPYMSTIYAGGEVMRIKWDPFDTAIYMEGAIFNFYTINGIDYGYGAYVDASYATFSDGTMRVRVNEPYNWGYEVDGNGIYSGIPYLDESTFLHDGVQMIINISSSGEAIMDETMLGFDLGYGEFFVGSVYPNVSTSSSTYPPGEATYDDDGNLVSIIFGANSLYCGMSDYNSGGRYAISDPTGLFFSVEAYQNYLAEE